MSEKMKIALLGVNHWHLLLYLPGPLENSVVGISNDDIGTATRYIGKHSRPTYQDYRQMVMETKLDFVFVFTPHYRMRETAEYLLQPGVPFSVEKPADVNAGEVEPLYEFCKKKNGFCSVPFVWRYSDTVSDPRNKYLIRPTTHVPYRFIAGSPPRYLGTSFWMLL